MDQLQTQLIHILIKIILGDPKMKTGKGNRETTFKIVLLNQLLNKVVMLKLSLPTIEGFYAELIHHPKVVRVVALSSSYDLALAMR
jgi:hypothetical protein